MYILLYKFYYYIQAFYCIVYVKFIGSLVWRKICFYSVYSWLLDFRLLDAKVLQLNISWAYHLLPPPGRIVYYSPRKLMLRKTFHILNRVLVYKLAFISCTGCSNHVEFKWNGREVDFQDQNANSEKMSIYVPVLSVRVRVTTKKSCFHILSLIISRFNCVVIWALSWKNCISPIYFRD